MAGNSHRYGRRDCARHAPGRPSGGGTQADMEPGRRLRSRRQRGRAGNCRCAAVDQDETPVSRLSAQISATTGRSRCKTVNATRSGRHEAAVTTEVGIRPVHPLHGHPRAASDGSATTCSKRLWEYPAGSILLTATTRCRTPSASSTANDAVEAAVATRAAGARPR